MFYCSGAYSLTLAQGGGSGDVAHIKCIHVSYVIIEGVDKINIHVGASACAQLQLLLKNGCNYK